MVAKTPPTDLSVDEDFTRLERALRADPGDAACAAALQRSLTRSNALARAFALAESLDDDAAWAGLAKSLALAQRPALEALAATESADGPHLIATRAPLGPVPGEVCDCPACRPGPSAGWEWVRLDSSLAANLAQPVLGLGAKAGAEWEWIRQLRTLRALCLPLACLAPAERADFAEIEQLESLTLEGWSSPEPSSPGLAGIGGARGLRKLRLFGVSPTPSQWEALAELRELRYLELRDTRWLCDDGLALLGPLRSLRGLCIASCDFFTGEGLEPLLEAGAPLTHADFSRCPRLSDEALLFLGEARDLEVLELRSCPRLSDDGLGYLGDAEALRTLNLAGSAGISEQGLSSLSDLSLEDLNLSNGLRLTALGVSALAQLPLRSLSLDCDDAGLAALRPLQRLEVLLLSSERISDWGLGALLELPSLREVFVGGERLGDQACAHLALLVGLKRARVHAPGLTDAGLRLLESMTGLEVLTLTGAAGVTPGGVERLRAALPRARVDVFGLRSAAPA